MKKTIYAMLFTFFVCLFINIDNVMGRESLTLVDFKNSNTLKTKNCVYEAIDGTSGDYKKVKIFIMYEKTNNVVSVDFFPADSADWTYEKYLEYSAEGIYSKVLDVGHFTYAKGNDGVKELRFDDNGDIICPYTLKFDLTHGLWNYAGLCFDYDKKHCASGKDIKSCYVVEEKYQKSSMKCLDSNNGFSLYDERINDSNIVKEVLKNDKYGDCAISSVNSFSGGIYYENPGYDGFLGTINVAKADCATEKTPWYLLISDDQQYDNLYAKLFDYNVKLGATNVELNRLSGNDLLDSESSHQFSCPSIFSETYTDIESWDESKKKIYNYSDDSLISKLDKYMELYNNSLLRLTEFSEILLEKEQCISDKNKCYWDYFEVIYSDTNDINLYNSIDRRTTTIPSYTREKLEKLHQQVLLFLDYQMIDGADKEFTYIECQNKGDNNYNQILSKIEELKQQEAISQSQYNTLQVYINKIDENAKKLSAILEDIKNISFSQNDFEENIYDCQTLLGAELIDWLTDAYNLVVIIVTLMAIVLSILDFVKAVTASDEEKINKAKKTAGKRLMFLAIFILLPMLINLGLNIAGYEDLNSDHPLCIKVGGDE